MQRIDQRTADSDASEARQVALEIADSLSQYRIMGDPNPAESMIVRADVLDRARSLVGLIQGEGIGGDRLGQAVRNLFECLGEGEEGADRGREAGEDPNSMQRP